MTELAVGQVWRRRDGEVVTITEYTADHHFPWKSDREDTYTRTGSFWVDLGKDSLDLVELISDAPDNTVTTQSNIQTGDTVTIQLTGVVTNTTDAKITVMTLDSEELAIVPPSSVTQHTPSVNVGDKAAYQGRVYEVLAIRGAWVVLWPQTGAGEAPVVQRSAVTRVLDDGWIPWNGGECPVQKDALVSVRFLCGDTHYTPEIAGSYEWFHFGSGGDIIAYKVLG